MEPSPSHAAHVHGAPFDFAGSAVSHHDTMNEAGSSQVVNDAASPSSILSSENPHVYSLSPVPFPSGVGNLGPCPVGFNAANTIFNGSESHNMGLGLAGSSSAGLPYMVLTNATVTINTPSVNLAGANFPSMISVQNDAGDFAASFGAIDATMLSGTTFHDIGPDLNSVGNPGATFDGSRAMAFNGTDFDGGSDLNAAYFGNQGALVDDFDAAFCNDAAVDNSELNFDDIGSLEASFRGFEASNNSGSNL